MLQIVSRNLFSFINIFSTQYFSKKIMIRKLYEVVI